MARSGRAPHRDPNPAGGSDPHKDPFTPRRPQRVLGWVVLVFYSGSLSRNPHVASILKTVSFLATSLKCLCEAIKCNVHDLVAVGGCCLLPHRRSF
ncbi:hypothetical protein CEXT_749431 [Caerostris extrusa]|uniref:Uncharacterized protein n=1 Tax=Caerostris extrusa TaxID=172846 RepID=A0AAV4RAX6_CAEEX|nr:hypothetical protein CEXT_749431 [Caerostris extrusa]